MKELLKKYLTNKYKLADARVEWSYQESINNDALTEQWLDNHTSYIYKVGVTTAIDSNKCDYAFIAIGTQRKQDSPPQIIGDFSFNEGENDDMGRVLERALNTLKSIHPAFDTD